jgi:Flp pilus assembly protein TadG
MKSLFNHWRAKGFLRPAREAGASIVEVALLIPLLMVILFGMIDLGRWVFLAIEVSSAARAGAQYGGQNRGTALDTTGIQTAAQNDVPDISGLHVASSTSTCWCSLTPGTPVSCSISSCPASGTMPNELIPLLQVTTSTSYSPWIAYPPFKSAVTITGQAVVPQGQ